MAEGTAAIGVQTRAIANIAIAGEAKAASLGFGRPALSVTGVVAAKHGTAALTTAASSLSGTGLETFSATGALAILAGTSLETFSAAGALTGAASSLASSGNAVQPTTGEVAITSAASALDSAGTSGYNAVVALQSGASLVAATGTTVAGSRRQQGGHNVVDLAGYTKFVNRGNVILEELGQPPAGTGATTPVVDPVPTVAAPDYRDILARSIARVALKPVVVPPLQVTGKHWVQGHVAQTTDPIWLSATGTNQFEFDYSQQSCRNRRSGHLLPATASRRCHGKRIYCERTLRGTRSLAEPRRKSRSVASS